MSIKLTTGIYLYFTFKGKKYRTLNHKWLRKITSNFNSPIDLPNLCTSTTAKPMEPLTVEKLEKALKLLEKIFEEENFARQIQLRPYIHHSYFYPKGLVPRAA